ncbi:hypothetical protein DWB61_16810 [Ancylomarina euxinus]|uniref:NRDE family protein n=1 Tax=Ancylomarina euxinus TaxID=2283627 RepID=A0A425XWU6_9BACT|nr:NRDE family protein [Ancylomarina euxinus]MCZ4696305.1 NRDE family protein [Ancylomarina euxinus]MUP16730.1 hypothetical protein [Ancylomarina euxinus]RRG19115.1 hypothetical protein DWB61_16810 [Ancylomarina euxinus]
MCTLSYIPISDQDFILTTNRDEDPNRVAFSPQKYLHDGIELFYPKDSKAKGSWIISNCIDTCLCLLNGAFDKHQRQPYYRQSRGLILLDFFKFSGLNDFIENYQFEGIEAFTMIVVENKSAIQITELIWDEKKLHVRELLSNEAHFWSSTTLYTKEMKLEREQWFRHWLNNETQLNQDTIIRFHKTGGSGNMEYGLFMNRRNLVRTVSITQIIGSEQGHVLKYLNLSDEEVCKTR